jgi:putative spermidine/putrescine transport system ATP-binding protein
VAGFVGTSNLISGDAARAITGSAETFTVRPEKIQLADLDTPVAAGELSVAGTVRDVVYVGINTRYIVALDRGGELVVVQQNLATSSMDALAAKGRRVKLVWNEQHNRTLEGGLASRDTPQEVQA